jgi:hypothetical protein
MKAVTSLPMICQSVLLRIFLLKLINVFICVNCIGVSVVWGDDFVLCLIYVI